MRYCSAYGCTEYGSANGSSFFKFPLNNKKLLKEWVLQVKRKNFKPSKNSLLCQKHFESECFEVSTRKEFLESISFEKSTRKKLNLKPGAIPTIFTHVKERKKRRKKSDVTDIFVAASVSETEPETITAVPNEIEKFCQAETQTNEKIMVDKMTFTCVKVRSKKIQATDLRTCCDRGVQT